MRTSSTSVARPTQEETLPQDCIEHRAALHALRMGSRFMKARTWSTAVIWLQQAIQIQPDCFEAYFLLGEVYLEMGEFRDAVEPYEKAIQLRPDDTTPHLKLGMVFIALKDWNAVLEQYQILRSLNEVIAKELFDKIIYSFNYEMFNSLFNPVY